MNTDYNDFKNRKAFYKSKQWRMVRLRVLKRDNYECVNCRKEGKVTLNRFDKHKTLDVDHIKELETHPELRYDLDNLQTLCIWCHNKKHNRYQKKINKKRWTDERWD